jgi:hypothetical protein
MTVLDPLLQLYLDRGWLIFPCDKRGPLIRNGNGFYDATNDVKLVTRWWTLWP